MPNNIGRDHRRIVVAIIGFIVFKSGSTSKKSDPPNSLLKPDKSIAMIKKIVKLSLSSFQLNGLLAKFNMQWPPVLQRLLDTQGSVGTGGLSLSSYACLIVRAGRSPFVLKSFAVFMLPIAVILVLVN